MTGSEFFFDTWAWVEILNGTRAGRRARSLLRKAGGRVSTSVLTIAEVAAKYAPLSSAAAVDRAVATVASRSRIQPVTETQARRAGPLRAELRRVKPGAGLVDALILAAAEQIGAKLVTGNGAFAGRANVLLL